MTTIAALVIGLVIGHGIRRMEKRDSFRADVDEALRLAKDGCDPRDHQRGVHSLILPEQRSGR